MLYVLTNTEPPETDLIKGTGRTDCNGQSFLYPLYFTLKDRDNKSVKKKKKKRKMKKFAPA